MMTENNSQKMIYKIWRGTKLLSMSGSKAGQVLEQTHTDSIRHSIHVLDGRGSRVTFHVSLRADPVQGWWETPIKRSARP